MVDVEQFLRRIIFMAREFGDYEMIDIVKLCLLDIGMPTDSDGYKYLPYGVIFLYENQNAMITKHIYPAIAKTFRCHSTHVEIAIRRAIGEAWRHRNENWVRYFPENRRLTNSEFVSTLVEVLTFWDTCRKSLAVKGVGMHE